MFFTGNLRKIPLPHFFLTTFLIFVIPGNRVVSVESERLLIVFTANNNGQLLDCGCNTEYPGGLPRRLTAINNLRKEYGEILLLEGGDFLGTTDVVLKNKFVMDAYDLFKYDGIAFGEQEFWNEVPFFENEILGRKQSFVCTNINSSNVKDQTKGRIIRKIKVIKNGYKLNIFALLHKNSFLYFPDNKIPSFQFEDVKRHLRSELKKVNDHSSLNIVIYHGDHWIFEELKKEFSEIAIWLIGHEPGNLLDSWQESSKPVIVQSGTDGESLELVEVSKSDKGKLFFNVKRLYLTEEIVPDVELKKSLEEYYNIINVPFKLKN